MQLSSWQCSLWLSRSPWRSLCNCEQADLSSLLTTLSFCSNPIQQWLMRAWRVGLGVSLKGKTKENCRMLPVYKMEALLGKGWQGTFLPGSNPWKLCKKFTAWQQMIQIHFFFCPKLVFTHGNKWRKGAVNFSISLCCNLLCRQEAGIWVFVSCCNSSDVPVGLSLYHIFTIRCYQMFTMVFLQIDR